MIKKLGSIWLYSFLTVSTLFIIAVVIYGFDIKKEEDLGPYTKSRALGGLIKNQTKEYFYYKVNDEYAYRVQPNAKSEENRIALVPYRRNFFPICFTCGFYTDDITKKDMDVPKQLSVEYIMSNHKEISFMGPDDEDCMISFMGLSLCYAILLIWGSLTISFKRRRKTIKAV
ncbi:MAG: hypothetical protein HRT68_11745 [Flavobacteriaceae bacterium]|nr:hypothetical protein [Flavobacteriaceae bacterium]